MEASVSVCNIVYQVFIKIYNQFIKESELSDV